jgi:hypothetical protein
VTRWRVFEALCAQLRAGLLGGEPPERTDVPWELLIEASSYHWVTPALGWCLANRQDLAEEVRDCFAAVLALNGKRNDGLLAALGRIVAACNAIAVEPVPLKGAARLIFGDYPAPSVRFLGDLDILVPADRAADVAEALRGIGFEESADDPVLPAGHHHLPMLHDRTAGGGVELHTGVLNGEADRVIPTAWFQARTAPCASAGMRIRVPDATASVGHIVAHDQLFHEGYWAGKFELRQLLDLAVIRAAHEAAIDWAELDRLFCQAGAGEVLATYLAFAEALLGQPAPRLSSAPRPNAVDNLRRKIEAGKLQRFLSTMRYHLGARRRRSAGSPPSLAWRKLPARIRRAAQALNQASWS